MKLSLSKTSKPYILFLPFLIIYIIYVILKHENAFWGDENKYVMFAQNILNGGYAGEDLYMGVGPGYPLFLVPFIKFNIPYIVGALFNALFNYLSIVLLYKIVEQFANAKIAMVSAFFWAIFINSFEYMHYLLPEIMPVLLLTLLLYTINKAFISGSMYSKHIFISAIILCYLALTKIIFGYVILSVIVIYLFFLLFNKHNHEIKKVLIISGISLLLCSPYLIYTFNVSGKVFYWGTTAGSNLYWLTSPYETEHGDWYAFHTLETDSTLYKINPLLETSFKNNHKHVHKELMKMNAIEQDDAYKALAIKNIKDNPVKFIQNWVANVGRIFFNYPYSYRFQKPDTLLRMPFSAILILLGLFSFIPLLYNWKSVNGVVKLAFIISLLYLGGSSLGSAETRMFTPIVPVLIIWIAYICSKTIKFQIKF